MQVCTNLKLRPDVQFSLASEKLSCHEMNTGINYKSCILFNFLFPLKEIFLHLASVVGQF